MKPLSSIALFLGLTHGKVVAKESVNVNQLLGAISAVENTPNDGIGRAGERSIYQMLPTVWEAFSNQPFHVASSDWYLDKRERDRVARAHIAWIRERLRFLHYADDPYHISLVWKAGYWRCLEKRVRTQDVEYAKRVVNVYGEGQP